MHLQLNSDMKQEIVISSALASMEDILISFLSEVILSLL